MEEKAVVLDVMGKGNLQKYEQQLRLEYMRGSVSVTPKIIIAIATSNPKERKPRSFRTDNPRKMKGIIKAMCKMLYQLELDLDGIKKKRIEQGKHGCPKCGAGIKELADHGTTFYCCKCGNSFNKKKFLNENGLARFNH